MIATRANMEQLRRDAGAAVCAPGVFMYSLATGDRFSASPGDYFWKSPDEPFTDQEGNPMFLCKATTTIEPVHAGGTR